MMAAILVPEREQLMELVAERARAYGDFSRRLYALMVVTATYAAQSRSLLTALEWMRFHRIRLHFDTEPGYRPAHGFLAEPLARSDYARAGLSEVEVAAYLHHLVIRPVLQREVTTADDRREMFRRQRLLYRMVTSGLAGVAEKERKG
jgi:hypothetical protein